MFYKRPSLFTKFSHSCGHVDVIFITLSLNCLTCELEVVSWALHVCDYYRRDTFDSCFYDPLMTINLPKYLMGRVDHYLLSRRYPIEF